MARPVWTGTISFGLVSIPIKLYHAVRHKNVSFNQLDDRSMSRVRYRKVSAATGDEVPEEHIVKGYEVSKDQYVVVDPEELDALVPVATKTIDLEEFVELDELDPILYETSYHVAPDSNAKPYALLARAMAESGRVAIGRFVMRSKQYTAAIRSVDGRLVMSTLAYADELIDPANIDEFAELDNVEVQSKEVEMAASLVESLAGPLDLDRFRDEYREQVVALIEQKARGEEFEVAEEEAEKPKIVDLMAALEASVEAAKQSRRSA